MKGPKFPNYGKRGTGKRFINGMVIAIEPMINLGSKRLKQLDDGWTVVYLSTTKFLLTLNTTWH